MAVIKHEAADLRRHVRTQIPIGIRIDGVPYTVKEWSLGGFRLEEFPVKGMMHGDRLFVQFTLPYQGLEVAFSTEVEVVRVSRDRGAFAARFLSLNAREKEVLGYAILGTSRNGDRASLIEKLALIDMPVTPTPVVPTAQESPQPKPALQTYRRILYTLVYWMIGLGLGTAISVLLYWYFFRLDLEYSVVTLPLYPVISQDVARCQELYVKEGDLVKQGDKLFRVNDDLLTRDLELAQLQFAAAEVDLKTAEARVKTEKDLLSHYLEITKAKLEQSKGQVAALVVQVEVGKVMLNRELELLKKNASAREAVNEKEVKLAGYEQELAVQRGEVRIAEQALKSLAQGSYYNSRQLVGDLPQYLVNLQDARERHAVAKERVKIAEDRARRLTYFAPFHGKVVKVLKAVDSTMNRGEAVAILEKTGEEPVIDSFITQDDANSLTLGTKATVWIPALDRTFHAEVVKIDRTSGFLTEMQAHLKESQLRYNWRGQQDRSAYMQLAFSENLSSEEWKALSGGMPAIVSVSRTPGLVNRVKSLFEY